MRVLNKQIIKFVFAGGSCFIFELVFLYFLTEYVNLYYLYSSAITFSITVMLNYLLCIKFVFENSKQDCKAFMAFFCTSIIGLMLNQVCMYIIVDIYEIYYMFAKVITTIIVTIWNYFSKKKVLTN